MTQNQINRLPKISKGEAASRKNMMANYVVYAHSHCQMEEIHIGLESENHLEAIKKLMGTNKIDEIRWDNRNSRNIGIGINTRREV